MDDLMQPVAWMNPIGGFLSARYIDNFASGLDKEIHNISLYTEDQMREYAKKAVEAERALLEQALYALENPDALDEFNGSIHDNAITALHARLIL